MLERFLVAIGRHATNADAVYWIGAFVAVAIGIALSLATGLWGLTGLAMAAYAGFGILGRRRYERSQGS